MLNNILISGIATFIIFVLIEGYRSFKQFLIFKRVRETILVATFGYLKKTPKGFVDLLRLKALLLDHLKEIKLSTWVKDINITWQSVDVIQFVFELKFEKLQPKYKFIIGLKDVEEIVEKTKTL
ncbi:hypothetical protein QE109_12275 [Fusibacter bizertensis]|jgi:hypothetical protein|uniref:Uncharacterized protein n=1 Tax=Fusibacter bizertensis TaxID=1488331 RepID=A0ABT6NES4_9FIRM|nr:hypothetical protein [Fusibacter bizertensis]MDH8678933.1 hypothetical protein [Fusibacter bizertensis]